MEARKIKKKSISRAVNETSSEDSDNSSNYDSDESVENKSNKSMNIQASKEVNENLAESDSQDSESDDESELDDSGDIDEDFDHKWQEMQNEAPDTNEITHRIAVCNMDWDRIRAIDLLVCFDSFKPANGSVNSVKIYPSEFGLKRLEEERLNGPHELVEKMLPVNEEDEGESKQESTFQREKLRQYQLNRLKYYYAVIDCDSPETAIALYDQLNGMEYENCGVRFDLRFIPDDMTFDQEPTSVADKLPNLLEYQPRLFVTTALQQIKVNLTWDETEPRRKEFFQKIFTNPDSVQDDIHDFIASASSESEEETDATDKESSVKLSTEQKIAKYRELLKSIEQQEQEEEEEKRKKYEVEVTWEPGLKEKTEEKVKEKMKKESLNPFEELLVKKKEDKKLKKKEQKKLQTQAEDSDDSEEELTDNSSNKTSANERKLAELALISDSKKEETEKITKKKKEKKEKSQELEGFVPNMNDPRFSAMYTSSLFNIPPENHPKKEKNFGFKRQKGRKFKSKGHESQKGFKKARHH